MATDDFEDRQRVLIYLASDGKLMSVPLESEANMFRPCTRPPFNPRPLSSGYRVTPDGGRFIINQRESDTGNIAVTVIVNLPKLLRK
jgi:hypothetical protein